MLSHITEDLYLHLQDLRRLLILSLLIGLIFLLEQSFLTGVTYNSLCEGVSVLLMSLFGYPYIEG